MNTKSRRGESIIDVNVFLALILMFFFGCCTGVAFTKKSYRTQAVKLGHATWVVDEAGKTTFKWKEAQ